jgi:hypothetical protein
MSDQAWLIGAAISPKAYYRPPVPPPPLPARVEISAPVG